MLDGFISGLFEDPEYLDIVRQDLATGVHRPNYMISGVRASPVGPSKNCRSPFIVTLRIYTSSSEIERQWTCKSSRGGERG